MDFLYTSMTIEISVLDFLIYLSIGFIIAETAYRLNDKPGFTRKTWFTALLVWPLIILYMVLKALFSTRKSR